MLIAWEGRRPGASLHLSGVTLDRLVVRGVGGTRVAQLLSVDAMVVPGAGPALAVTLRSGAGSITLPSIA